MKYIPMRLTVGGIISQYRTPLTSDEGFVLDAKFCNLASIPYMPMTIAIFLGFVQIDYKVCLTHSSPFLKVNSEIITIF